MKIFCALLLAFLLVWTTGTVYSLETIGSEQQEWKISPEQQSFLDALQQDTFNFFWETTEPQTGLTPDQAPDGEFSSIAGIGFALTSYLVGVERNYITRPQAVERTLNTLRFLLQAPQGSAASEVSGYKGFFYHFLSMDTGHRYKETELSTIDTALLMTGVLSSQTYFDGDNDAEKEIRDLADSLYRRVDWQWAYSEKHKPLLSLSWSPEEGFSEYHWSGYNEAMILYILALGSPTYAIEPAAWARWTSTYAWADFYGYPHLNFGPLFGHQYSHVWVDFRDIQDHYMRSKGIDYFINSRRATYSNRAYCIDNPQQWNGYSDVVWGLTASNGPNKQATAADDPSLRFRSYWARGSSSDYRRDDGTIAPTAVGGSLPFAPEITIPTLAHLRAEFGDRLYGKYGLKDAFNLSYQDETVEAAGWFDDYYLAIDQGPILLMIENYRSKFVWNLMKRNEYILRGLKQAGFSGGWIDLSRSLDPPGPAADLKTPGIPFLNNQTHACPVWVSLARAHLNLPAAMGTTSSPSSNIAAAVMFSSP